jgi:serine/threonine-protein kinase SRPK3
MDYTDLHNNNYSRLADSHPHKLVALKIQKSASQYMDAAKDEIELLGCLKSKDPLGESFVVQLLDHFFIYGPHGKRKIFILCYVMLCYVI